ncbi:magnesium transporter CorA family protein [Priestia abyssalis]|uniref:hypothetical protein n=1 Tax=Priestia abyssalis TaxID=1221450 RepID=UPI0009954861|nr:hypothetical protein [Priestia abyssalis]
MTKHSINIQPLRVHKAMPQFLFPFSILKKEKQSLIKLLGNEGFHFYTLENEELENAFYGDGFHVSHSSLDQYFLPYIEQMLFPQAKNDPGLLRFSKSLNHSCVLKTKHHDIPFSIHSVDIILCPFDIGIMTIRTEVNKDESSYSDVLDFMNHFRVLEPKLAEQRAANIICCGETFKTVQKYIFSHLFSFIVPFVDRGKKQSTYFGSLPYFVDERMYAIGYMELDNQCEMDDVNLFRTGQLNSYDKEGHLFISAHNMDYIQNYVDKHVHKRWAPETYYTISDHAFSCLTFSPCVKATAIGNEWFGQNYYNLLLHFFYKIVLLKLTYEYSTLNFEKDQDNVEKLIKSISVFSAKYLFSEISSRTEGQEFSQAFKEVFHINSLYKEVKETLSTLYQNQEKMADKRNNYLLLILTIYTVISGIYGMNLVIEDWKGKIDWAKLANYSLFEYISLVVAVSGIILGIAMAIGAVFKLVKEFLKKREGEER